MAEQAAGRFAADGNVTQEFHDGRVVGIELGGAALDAVDHGRQAQVTVQRIAALLVQVAHGGADLIVRVCADIFHQKIDQTRVALQNSQDLEGSVGGLGYASGRGGLGGGLLLFCGENPSSCAMSAGNLPLKRYGEETTEREYDPAQNDPLA